MIAIENNDIKIINYLLTNNKQIDVNVQTKYNGYTALHLPFLGNKMDDNATKQMILLLIKYKTIQLLPDYKTKQTPLHLAVVSNQNELCLKMIKIYFNNHKNDIDVLNQQSLPHKHTILHLSAIKNYINLCKLLLKLGANPFLKNIKNETFYETAKKYGHEGIVEVYNEMDEKDKEKFEQIEIIGEENKEKDEQKEEEKSLYSTQELRKRLAEKSNHNSNNYNNNKPLRTRSDRKLDWSTGIIDIKNDLKTLNKQCIEYYWKGIENNDYEITRVFLQHNKIDVNLFATSGRFAGQTALHIACTLGHYETLYVLIAEEAKINIQSKISLVTPLLLAVRFNHIECVEYLLKETSVGMLDVNIPALDETTPFYEACYNNNIEIIKLLILYANNLNITTTQNNPCNISTWTTPTTYYDNTIVLITYNHIYDTLCTPQQWTLNLQTYNANIKAVLIAHNIVQPLSGDTKLNHPIIPTRIISKDSSNKIINIITNTTENITASIDCFNDTTHPPIICFIYSGNDWMQGNELTTHSNLVIGADTTVISRFDGEFQEQSGIIINDHPVWKKDEHDGLIVWSDYYIWLTVNHSASNDQNPWRWVIGRNYLNDQTIEAECILNTTNYIDDPTLCGNNWYRNGINGTIRQYNLTSHAGICNLGDMFLCVDTTGPNASTVSGRYRQFHKNSDYWIHESRLAYLMLWPNVFGWGLWNWVFAEGIYIDFVAICPLFNAPSANEPLPMDIILRPQDCGPQWYIVVPNIWPPQAVSTLNFDADICTHANVTEAPIYYPPILCMRDIINPDSSLYQTYHGIYLLDNTSIYDGKYVYKNQRLNGSDSWYLLWVDEFDRWVINEQIPPVDIPSNIYGRTDRCMSHLDTPDTCDDCWWFYDSFWTEYQCNISVIPINSYIESDCIGDIAINNIINYTQEILICFDDGNQNIYANPITGYWILTNNTFNDRPVWTIIYSYIDDDINTIVEISYFMYYSKRWKY
eukprot:494110_1